MTVLKRSRREYALIGVSALLLIPLLMAAIAPFLAPVPSQAASWTAPQLPDRDEPLPDFQHLLDPLPLIVRDLPDAESQEVVSIYDAATLADHQASLNLLEAAERAVPVPSSLTGEWTRWLDRILEGDWESEPVPIPRAILQSLSGDPRNGDRLSNLAMAIYFTELTTPFTEETPYASLFAGPVVANVFWLLQSAKESFPESRGATLNTAALLQLRSSNMGIPGVKLNTVQVLEPWLDNHPEDATALLLLMQYPRGRSDAPDQSSLQNRIDQFVTEEDASRLALAHALRGDLLLIEATGYPPYPQYTARRILLQALADYDRALELSDDPSVYFARATTLESLGDIPSAIESQERALQLDPNSATGRVRLAQLHLELRGDASAVLDAAETARSLSREVIALNSDQSGPLLSEIKLVLTVPTLGWRSSLSPEALPRMLTTAFFRPERYVIPIGDIWGGAGGGVASFDSIPIYATVPSVIRPDPMVFEAPVMWAARYAILGSVILGDPAGASEDWESVHRMEIPFRWLANHFLSTSDWMDPVIGAAHVLSDPTNFAYEDLDYFSLVIAVDAARYVGLSQRALEICGSALKVPNLVSMDDSMFPPMLWTCVAENAYLAGDYEKSQQAFETLGNDLMVGYVAERRGNLDDAEDHYRKLMAAGTPESYLAMLRLADMTLQKEPAEAVAIYDQVIESGILTTGGCEQWCLKIEDRLSLAYSNRGIARLQLHADRNGTIECEGETWEACNAAFLDFSAALESDPDNPVFLMNKGWAARLLGDQNLSAELMNQALESDPTLYPVLNDLGFSATGAGDTAAARQYFQDALAANPLYDLAWWNLGVLNMQQGIGGIFRGQAYLARAIVQNPSLVTGSLDFRTDERFYRVEINEQLRPGAGWTFGTASSVATATFGFITFMLMCIQAFRLVGIGTLQDTVTNWASTGLDRIQPPGIRKPSFVLNDQWSRWLPLAVAITVLVFTTTRLASRSEPHATSASVALALFAVVLAVVVHEFGHSLAAKHFRTTLESAQWAPGTMLSLLLLPVNLSSGPFPGQRVVAGDVTTSKWVYLAGPLANLTVAIGAYFLFSLQPLPWLRQISQVQLAAMGYALLPFAPLDGAALASSHPRLLGVMGGVSLLLGVLFSLGIL